MKISVVTVSLNSVATLRDTMLSVLAQKHVDLEHIIVDGGSTDGTLELIKEIEPQYEGRLKWFSSPDNGLYEAMNKGVALAMGDIIGMLNSDDYFSDVDVLSRLAESFDDSISVVYGNVHFVRRQNTSHCVRYYTARGFAPWKFVLGEMPPHPAFYCRSDVFKSCGGFNTTFHNASDFDFMVRVLYCHRLQARYLPLDCVTMRMGGLSTSGVHSLWVNLYERHRSLKENGLIASYLMLLCGYPSKLFQLVMALWSE
jgi:glycosyltransferase involved in cell wall biosynthesis